MIGLYILAGVIILFCAVLLLNASVRVIYNSAKPADAQIYMQVGFYKYYIMPQKPRKKKQAEPSKKVRKAKKKKKTAEKKVEQVQESRRDKWRRYEGLIAFAKDTGLMMLRKTRRNIKIRVYKLNISAGAADAYETAMMYAKINQAAYYAHEILSHNFDFKLRDANISADFLSGKLSFEIDIKAGMKIGAGLGIALAAAVNFVKFRSRGVAESESENKKII